MDNHSLLVELKSIGPALVEDSNGSLMVGEGEVEVGSSNNLAGPCEGLLAVKGWDLCPDIVKGNLCISSNGSLLFLNSSGK